MRSMSRSLALGLTLATIALAGCKNNDACRDRDDHAKCTDCEDPANCQKCNPTGAAIKGATNTTCPISGEPVSADVKTVSFKGQEVGFCCNGCVGKFAALSDAEKAAKLGIN